jgi:hypothetical protein
MTKIKQEVGELIKAEAAQLKNIETGTNQHIDGEYNKEKEEFEKKISQPTKDFTV